MPEYIEREAAKKAMCRMCEGGAKLVCGRLNDCCTTMRVFNSIPAADVRPVRRGRWVHRESEVWGGGYTICSACGYGYLDAHYHEVEEFNFCPNCGCAIEKS